MGCGGHKATNNSLAQPNLPNAKPTVFIISQHMADVN